MTTLKVRFVYQVKNQEQPSLVPGRVKIVSVPVGAVHYFELIPQMDAEGKPVIEKGKVVHEASRFSLCNRTRSEIGKSVGEGDTRPAGLHICPDCEEKYKQHPASLWRAWTVAMSILVLFFLLGCLSPSVAAAVLTPAAPASTETARRAAPTEGRPVREGARCVRVKAESLHVRDLPGYEAGQVVGYLFGGQVVRVFDWQEVNGTRWYQVREGWSSGAWMEAAECP